MAWDQSRPVPWRRLVRDWLFYVVVMVVFLLIFGQLDVGILAGVLVSGPLFVLLGAALAKLGYQRKTLKELRAESAAARAHTTTAATRSTAPSGARSRPAPTKRTSGGGNRPTRKRR